MKIKYRKVLFNFAILIIIISMLIYVYGCARSENNNGNAQQKTIHFIVKMRSGDYWNTVQMGAYEAAKEFNVNMEFEATDSESDIEGQKKLVEEAIEKKADAIVLAASDYEQLKDLVEKANEDKIPVIIIDSTVNTNKILSTISSDNLEAGKMAGEKLVELTGENANVAILSYVKDSESAKKREEGVYDILSKHSNVNVVAKEYCNSDEDLAFTLTKNIIEKNKNLNGIVALNSNSSLGAERAIEKLGLTGKIKLVSFDRTVLGIQYLERNVTQATIVQNPFSMGYLSMKYAAMAARGNKVPQKVNMDLKVVDKYNLYSEENQKFMFPYIN